MGWLASVHGVTFPFVWQLSKHTRAERHCCWAFAVVWHCIPMYLSQLSGGFMGSLGSKQRRITLAPRPLFKRCLALVTNTRLFLSSVSQIMLQWRHWVCFHKNRCIFIFVKEKPACHYWSVNTVNMFSMSLPSCVIAATLCTVRLIHPPLWSQPGANNYMEEDKWQHPQKSKTSEVPGSSGNPQHSARGLWNLWMQSWESQRRHSLQRPSAGLQWVGACAQLFLLHFSLSVCVHCSHSQVENSSIVLWFLFLERTLLLSVWFCMGW